MGLKVRQDEKMVTIFIAFYGFFYYFYNDPAFYNFSLERQVNLLVSFIVKEEKKEVVMVIYKLYKGFAKITAMEKERT